MPRGQAKAKTPRRSRSSWALLIIDANPFREKARASYQKVLRDLKRAREEMERFEKHDKPNFTRWLHRRFGAIITEIRELTQRLATQRELLFEIENEAVVSRSSHPRAYERVMRRRDQPEANSEPENARHNQGEGRAKQSSADPFAGLFDELNGDWAEDAGAAHNGHAGARGHGEEGPLKRRIKELYRALARRLHPDVQEAMSPQKKEWWHQAQAAYQTGDVEQLQMILTLCDIEEEGNTAKTSVSLLMLLTSQFKLSLSLLKVRMAQFRRDPAWNFGTNNEHDALGVRTERLLLTELSDVKRSLAAIEQQLSAWAAQSRPPQKRRPVYKGYRERMF